MNLSPSVPSFTLYVRREARGPLLHVPVPAHMPATTARLRALWDHAPHEIVMDGAHTRYTYNTNGALVSVTPL